MVVVVEEEEEGEDLDGCDDICGSGVDGVDGGGDCGVIPK